MVLSAKLRPPRPRPDSVRRERLIERLEDARREPLRAVVAPTGWGKSEVVAQWLEQHAHPTAYVRLDRHDVDASRCWAHVLVAVRQAADVPVDDLLAVLRAPGLPIVAEVVEPLLVRLEGSQVTVVIEDLSLADGAEIHESLEAFVDGRPPGIGITLVSRIEPPFHLPRRRVRDDLIEVRAADLRMSADEARGVVDRASRSRIDRTLVERLVERTEGWPAGLYLAGLSLRGTEDAVAVVERFSGSDRSLSEYLATEVLATTAAEEREFLVRTSVLAELDAGTCDAVLGRADSAARLDALSRSNQLVIPVDERSGTYRYHQLFQEWLMLELARTGDLADAHRRAAAALSSQGDVVTAAGHAVSSGDADLAHDLVTRASLPLFDSGRHRTLTEYCRALPSPDTADRAVRIALLRAWSAIVDGDLDTVERWCDRAAASLDRAEAGTRARERAGDVHLLRAYAHLLRGAPDRCRAELSAAGPAGVSKRAGASATYLDAASTYWLGLASDQAMETVLAAACETAAAIGDPYAVLLCEAHRALHLLDLDRPDDAAYWTDRAFATAREHDLVGFGYLAAPTWARARAALLGGDFATASRDAGRAVELAERRGDTLVACGARLTHCEVLHGSGDRRSASELLSIVEQDLTPLGSPGVLGARIEVVRRQLRLQQPPVTRRRVDEPVERLTDRELSLLRLLPGELTQRELGAALHMSFNTVKTYNRQIYRKLGVSSRDDAVAVARAVGLL